MVARFLAYLRPPLVACGHLVALVLLVLDARREWSAYGLVMLLLLLGALAAIPAALVDSPGFRLISLIAQTVGAGVVALALHDSADKRALWVYALSVLVAVISPTSRPGLGRTTVIGVGTAVALTIGVSAPARSILRARGMRGGGRLPGGYDTAQGPHARPALPLRRQVVKPPAGRCGYQQQADDDCRSNDLQQP